MDRRVSDGPGDPDACSTRFLQRAHVSPLLRGVVVPRLFAWLGSNLLRHTTPSCRKASASSSGAVHMVALQAGDAKAEEDGEAAALLSPRLRS